MPIFLHAGCGHLRKEQTTAVFAGPDWNEIRLDIDPAVKPDLVGTLTDLSAVPSGTVDAVFSSHSLEHLYPHEVPTALKEFLRVLTDDGFAVITCPDLQSVCALVAEDKLDDPAYVSQAGPIAPLDMLYGHRAAMAAGNLYMAHRTGFTQKVLRAALQGAGFESVATAAVPKAFALWAVASRKTMGGEALARLARQHIR